MKITKEQFQRLYAADLLVLERKKILAAINDRFSEIVLFICPKANKGRNWFDYGNCDYRGESQGFFDESEYQENIQVGGEGFCLPEPYDCESLFPTRWLWEDFEPEFERETYKYQQQKLQEKLNRKIAREDLKLKKQEFKKIITEKLTKEELKYIKFK